MSDDAPLFGHAQAYDPVEAIVAALGFGGQEADYRSYLDFLGIAPDENGFQPEQLPGLTSAALALLLQRMGMSSAIQRKALLHVSRLPPEFIVGGEIPVFVLDGTAIGMPTTTDNRLALFDCLSLKQLSDAEVEEVYQRNVVNVSYNLDRLWQVISQTLPA